jgi:CO/xanthine dehydrogenase Mo-binding subunit
LSTDLTANDIAQASLSEAQSTTSRSGRQAGLPAGSGRGRGIGFARYKNLAAYAAIVAEVEVDREVRLVEVWCAADAGFVVNPDGAKNQLEGGVVQAASWALKEGVRLRGGIAGRDWGVIRCCASARCRRSRSH